MSRPGVHRALPGERVVWEGRPAWRALARDALHIRLVALYFAVMLIWSLADARADGASPGEAIWAVLPSLLLDLLVLAAFAGFAWGLARTTRYTVTTERCLIEFGIALRATVSIPWRRVAAGHIAVAGDGTGSIPLALKPGPALNALKLWPHVRIHGWRAEPALRSVPDAVTVGAIVAQAARIASPARVMPRARREFGCVQPGCFAGICPAGWEGRPSLERVFTAALPGCGPKAARRRRRCWGRTPPVQSTGVSRRR